MNSEQVENPERPDPSIEDVLVQAKQLIERGEMALRIAVEKMAMAHNRGASQRQIATAVGKSVAWVNKMLQWRDRNYRDRTPFGPQSKASRRRKSSVQAAERAKRLPEPENNLRDMPSGIEPNSVAQQPIIEESNPPFLASAPSEQLAAPTRRPIISRALRESLVGSLNELASTDPVVRADACKMIEQHRAAIGMTWSELIIPADDTEMAQITPPPAQA